eukprot:gene43-56_t
MLVQDNDELGRSAQGFGGKRVLHIDSKNENSYSNCAITTANQDRAGGRRRLVVGFPKSGSVYTPRFYSK